MVRLISLVFCLLVIVCVEGMRKQGVAIKGRLKCGHFPAQSNSTRVRIVDIDTGPDPDDTLDEKFVDRNGDFKPCHRKITFKIPQKFIVGDEPKPEEWVDIGQINLQSVFENENRDCIF
ncbi:transthyretin-like family domain-containing protein [Ditylenchus destructor]|nr:transthyretin-like family domain-containing protein [Ditylenchus destructor]